MNQSQSEYVNGCELPNNYHEYDPIIQLNIVNYLRHLSPIEVRAYGIAKKHLKSSFNLVRSNGYINWLETQT
jgi:hypothetical protein